MKALKSSSWTYVPLNCDTPFLEHSQGEDQQEAKSEPQRVDACVTVVKLNHMIYVKAVTTKNIKDSKTRVLNNLLGCSSRVKNTT